MKQVSLTTRRFVAGVIILLYFFSVGFAYLSHEHFHAQSHICGQTLTCHHTTTSESPHGEAQKQWQATSHLCKWFQFMPPQILSQEITLVSSSEICWTEQTAPILLPRIKKIPNSRHHRGPPYYYS
ncbi:hypothetical protein OAT16_05450 [Prolixibacteraceae bacterium]|nr:hypothetical protein [Prolixibacteraceae bacterium]